MRSMRGNNMSELTAAKLAEYIEWVHAKDRVEILNGRHSRYPTNVFREYDPLAATCLGMLIHSIVTKKIQMPRIPEPKAKQ